LPIRRCSVRRAWELRVAPCTFLLARHRLDPLRKSSPKSPLKADKRARSGTGLLDSGGLKRLALRCTGAARTTLELALRMSHDDVCGGKQICSNATINYTFSRLRPVVRIPSAHQRGTANLKARLVACNAGQDDPVDAAGVKRAFGQQHSTTEADNRRLGRISSSARDRLAA
jgi:hypothetical protein